MKIIIFAGGTGTRFWPLSRKKFPKHFKKIFNGEKKLMSTLQLAVERVEKTFGSDNIYISTNENYVSLVKDQLPQISTNNIIAEPLKRDVGPAVGFALINLRKIGYRGPVALLWADHLIGNVDEFINALKTSRDIVYKTPEKVVIIAEEPRYAENNLGWIHVGRRLSGNLYEFEGWKYRPPLNECINMFGSNQWKWNPGYFVGDVDNLLSLYKHYQPIMYKLLTRIEQAIGTAEETATLHKLYPKLEPIHFDTAIAEKIEHSEALVVCVRMHWSDPGTLYALKEGLLGMTDKNLEKGRVYTLKTTDSVVINEDKHKLVTTYGLDGVVVVNTQDALIVTHRDKVAHMSELVQNMEKSKDFADFT
mgnify:FL=1|jgi:mannose-1-phosphate guanylyltransferase